LKNLDSRLRGNDATGRNEDSRQLAKRIKSSHFDFEIGSRRLPEVETGYWKIVSEAGTGKSPRGLPAASYTPFRRCSTTV
jgi:hypothetical protein